MDRIEIRDGAPGGATPLGHVVYTRLDEGVSIDPSVLIGQLGAEGLDTSISTCHPTRALRHAVAGSWLYKSGEHDREVVFRPDGQALAALLLERRRGTKGALGASSGEFSLGRIGAMSLDGTGVLRWEAAPDAPADDGWGAVVQKVLARFAHVAGHVCAADVHSYFTGLLTGKHVVPLKGGVFFAPVLPDGQGGDKGAAPALLHFSRALGWCGAGGVYAMPVYADSGTRASVRDAARDEITGALTALEAELAKGLGPKAASNRLPELMALFERASLYEELVQFKAESVADRLGAAREALSALINAEDNDTDADKVPSSKVPTTTAPNAALAELAGAASAFKQVLGSGKPLRSAVRNWALTNGWEVVGHGAVEAPDEPAQPSEAPEATPPQPEALDAPEGQAEPSTEAMPEPAPVQPEGWTADRIKAVARLAKSDPDGRSNEDGLSVRFEAGVYRWELRGEEGRAKSMNALVADVLAVATT